MGHVTDTKCKCGCPKQTIEHIFWECTDNGLADIRGKYFKAIDDIHTLLLCVQPNVLNTKTYKHTGLLPEDERVHEAEAKLGESINHTIDQPKVNLNQHANLEWWQMGYRRCFSDGARNYPDDNRRGRAAFAVFYGFDHPWNIARPVCGFDQTAYRAELSGCSYALETAEVPTWLALDNESVVMTAAMLARGHDVLDDKIQSYDLWLRVRKAINKHYIGYFCITWIKGHMDKHPEYIRDGIHTQTEADWHIECDKHAGSAAHKAGVPFFF